MVSQFQLNRGEVATSLNTTGAGAVIGTSFAIPSFGPGGQVKNIGWQTVADGSALNVILEGSMDDVSFAQLDTSTTATGDTKNVNTNVRFIRARQVSRTGGTATTATIYVS